MALVLHKWGLRAGQVDWGTPPEMVPYFLVGEIDGQSVEALINRRTGEVFECANGQSYELGEVHPDYDRHIGGNAREKMLSGFKTRS